MKRLGAHKRTERKIMRIRLLVLCMTLCSVTPAMADVSVGIRLGNVSIGVNLPRYPELVRVPGYPVYYAPRLNTNYFFYDGEYWVYLNDSWYSSPWYNGPWDQMDPEYVPVYILRIPIRYYRQPPAYFRGWSRNAPPRWGEHWGHDWAQRRSGWDRWDHRSAPAPAPLPRYQKRYSGTHYPRVDQQQTLQRQNYRYQPRDPLVRQLAPTPQAQHPSAPSRSGIRIAPQPAGKEVPRNMGSRPPPSAQPAPHGQPNVAEPSQRPAPARVAPQRQAPPARPAVQRSQPAPGKPQVQHSQPAPAQHQPPGAGARDQGGKPQAKGAGQEQKRGQGGGKDDNRDQPDDRGQGRQH
jgi:hypothetical protein